jgi:hypothetical protein
MQFSLQTLLLSFVVVAASLSLCGPWGLLLAAVDLICAGYIRMAKDRRQAWVNVLFYLIFFSIFLCMGVLPTSLCQPRINTRSMQCRNNQRQVALALHAYADQHGHFPPAYIADANGKPMHSWRVLILRELDRRDLYDAYDFNEPWNGPHNSKLASAMPKVYECPSQQNKTPNCANYVAVVGPRTIWPGEKLRGINEIMAKDGSDHTVFFLELPNSDINWMEPRDLSYDELVNQMTPEQRAKIFNAHKGMSVVTYADVHQSIEMEPFLQKNIGALLTIDDGEKIDFNDNSGPSYLQPDDLKLIEKSRHSWWFSLGAVVISCVVLIVTTLYIIYRPLPSRTEQAAREDAEEIRRDDTNETETKSEERERGESQEDCSLKRSPRLLLGERGRLGIKPETATNGRGFEI